MTQASVPHCRLALDARRVAASVSDLQPAGGQVAAGQKPALAQPTP